MPIVASTLVATDVKNLEKQVAKAVSTVWDEKTPFYSAIKKSKTSVLDPTWQVRAFPVTTLNNAKLNGDSTVSYTTQPGTELVTNYCQLMDKGFLFSDVLEKLDTYEKKSAAQVLYMQAGEAIRFDVEAAISRPTTSKPENATAARMAGVESFLITNTSRVAGGANGGYNSTTKIVNAPTDATVGLRNGTTIEKDITDVLEKIADSSGSATGVNIHLGLKLRGEFSRRVSGRGTLTQNFDAKKQGGITVTGSIKYFESDYGFHAVMLNQRQRGRSIMLLNDDFLELPVLEEMDIITEGKQGHATRKFYKWQGSLKVLNERAHGIVADYDSVLFGDSVGTTK